MGECLTFTSKSACLMILATLCIALVIWTVIETSQKVKHSLGFIQLDNITSLHSNENAIIESCPPALKIRL